MRNPSLPKLLRAMGNSEQWKNTHYHIIFEQGAIELEKLENIYKECEKDVSFYVTIREILNNE